ncbi:phage baseplate assembly protein [Roseomonas sp. F4]
MNDIPTLLLRDRLYQDWTSIAVTRSLDQAAAQFRLEVAPAWEGLTPTWPIREFDAVALRLGDDLVLTGAVDAVDMSIDHRAAAANVSGRSRTADLVDCMPRVDGTEFRRSTLPAICRALGAGYGIDVVEDAPSGEAFALERFDRTDTCWDIIERLCRMRGLLATDDVQGRLVLTRASTRRASGALVLGDNIISMSVDLNGAKRFRDYIVLSQSPSAAARQVELEDEEELPQGGAQPAITASARDPDVPRNRLRVIRAESDGTAADARARAVWAATTARARALSARVRVPGWRQPDGRLWQVNELVPVRAARLQVERDLLVESVTFTMSSAGRTTDFRLVPPEALTPEPLAQPRAGRDGGGGGWADVVPIQ